MAVVTTRATHRRAVARSRWRGPKVAPLFFLAPWLAGITLFFAYPLAMTVYLSFTSYTMLDRPEPVGLRNYVYMFTEDPRLWQAVGNTGWFIAVMVPAQVLFALGAALVLTRIKSGAGFFRTVFYLPSLAPPVAATVAFVFLFNPATGPVNQVLAAVGVEGPLWFSDPAWAKPGLVLLALWGSGNLIVILLAALLDVPAELHEAAAIDGASSRQRFVHVTLPSIAPVLLFAVVTGVIGALQYFTQAVVAGSVASGSADITPSAQSPGPPEGSTLTLPYWLFVQGFQRFNMGYACALAVMLFLVSLAFIAVLLRRRSGFAGSAA
ncbi:carbohydrate ABC transporter permease [Nonomuraea lactucae]|uniref:carbohydrate ABC transporter permease n=1 Tax=Nonomuraea lactucae TaxID=2249762 RepID=UPI000DE4F9B5|nr:sugar ABC transporter permease [Nonomuraea lactucae]